MGSNDTNTQINEEKERLLSIAGRFLVEGDLCDIAPHGNGHINDTYLLSCILTSGGRRKYILQRINHDIFKNPEQLMENIVSVTSFLQDKIQKSGGDPKREALHVVPVRGGGSYCRMQDGAYWRMYEFVEGASSYDAVKRPEDFYESAVAFGKFQRLLSDFPAASLHETIPDFHNTPVRLERFREALAADKFGRRASVQEEIDFVLDRAGECHAICDLLDAGELPLRVTHNDTKLNNIMMDDQTGKGICVIDLDTVMPGSALYDYGDAIRFGASTGAEDETDLSKVSCDPELFSLYTEGYIKGCGGSLTGREIRMLPVGAKLMTLECGIRFLTDYLEGDHYFKTHREGHNLDRARTQFHLVKDMEDKWSRLETIVEQIGRQEANAQQSVRHGGTPQKESETV